VRWNWVTSWVTVDIWFFVVLELWPFQLTCDSCNDSTTYVPSRWSSPLLGGWCIHNNTGRSGSLVSTDWDQSAYDKDQIMSMWCMWLTQVGDDKDKCVAVHCSHLGVPCHYRRRGSLMFCILLFFCGCVNTTIGLCSSLPATSSLHRSCFVVTYKWKLEWQSGI